MKTLMKQLWKDESGLTLVEYAIGAAVVSVVAYAAMKMLGSRVDTLFGNVDTSTDQAAQVTSSIKDPG